MRVLCFLIFIAVASVLGDESKERISIRKCREYSKNITKPCVVREENSNNLASPKEFPHMALIGIGPEDDKQWVCSGSLISDQFVITTGHCARVLHKGLVKWVRLGEIDYASPRNESKYFDYSIRSIHRHPEYRRLVTYNNIGLLRLDRKVIFSEYIRPACLYTESDDTLNEFLISGWPINHPESENNSHLKWAKGIKKVDSEVCNDTYKYFTIKMKDGINKDLMFCTEQGPGDICEITGSRGAPIQIFNEDTCMYDIVGLSSYGADVCYTAPVVHTKIFAYIDFIERYVWILPEEEWLF